MEQRPDRVQSDHHLEFRGFFLGLLGFVTRDQSLEVCFLIALLLSGERCALQASKETPFALKNAPAKVQRAAPAFPTRPLTNATP